MKATIGILAAILALLLAAGVFLYLDGNKAKAEIARLTSEIERRIQAEVDRTKAECERKAREDMKQLQGQFDGLKSKLADAEKRAAEERGRIEELSRQLGLQTKDLEQRLKKTPGQKPEDVKVAERGGQVQVTVASRILFESGSDRLRNEGMEVLRQIADSVRNDASKEIHVVGHTDNLPVREEFRSLFGSNWELSSSRATAAVRYLQEACKVPGERLVAEGRGQTRSVASNDAEEGRSKNRRIEILLVPADGR